MKLVAMIDYLRDHLKAVMVISCVALALLVAGDWLLVDKEHAHTRAEHYVGFWAAFGFVACVLIIFISKWFGHLGIMKREDYYGDE